MRAQIGVEWTVSAAGYRTPSAGRTSELRGRGVHDAPSMGPRQRKPGSARKKAHRADGQPSTATSGAAHPNSNPSHDEFFHQWVGHAGEVVGVLALLMYLNSIHGALMFDDEPAIVRNMDLRPQIRWRELLTHDFWGTSIRLKSSNKSYRPLTVATFKLNYLIHGLKPEGYHAVGT